jgi:hypothetical protein
MISHGNGTLGLSVEGKKGFSEVIFMEGRLKVVLAQKDGGKEEQVRRQRWKNL